MQSFPELSKPTNFSNDLPPIQTPMRPLHLTSVPIDKQNEYRKHWKAEIMSSVDELLDGSDTQVQGPLQLTRVHVDKREASQHRRTLFLVLISVLPPLFLILVGCILFYIYRMAHRAPQPPAGPSLQLAAVQGLDQSVIESFSRVSFPPEDRGILHGTTGCDICLGDFKPGNSLMIFPTCPHVYHVSCIETWLVRNSTCSMCRHDYRGT